MNLNLKTMIKAAIEHRNKTRHEHAQSMFRDTLIMRISVLIGQVPIFGSELFGGVPIESINLDGLGNTELMNIYERAVQVYWRSRLVNEENFNFGDYIDRQELLAAMNSAIRHDNEEEIEVVLVDVVKAMPRMTGRHGRPPRSINAHEQNLLQEAAMLLRQADAIDIAESEKQASRKMFLAKL